MRRFLKRRRNLVNGPLPQPTREDLRIRSLLDHPGLRRAMELPVSTTWTLDSSTWSRVGAAAVGDVFARPTTAVAAR